ncbi:MAG: hypothetical protein KJN81_01545 [Acidimicrobiia bacterium]|nr:hypothetical protein [Acidimicrobiia bacterium]NNL27092.1 hypothetical protein [Acidimicrobiia bacterium]
MPTLIMAITLTACSGGTITIPEAANSVGALADSQVLDTTSSPASETTAETTDGDSMPRAVEDAYTSAVDRARNAFNDARGRSFGTEEFGLSMSELTSRIEDVETYIGTCMAAAGFEYIPVDFSTIRSAMTSDKSAPGLSGSEYRSQFGHGITTQPDKPIVTIGLGDQNRRILDSLSEPDRVAYERTLWGSDLTATFAFALESENFARTGGCTRAAVDEFFSEDETSTTYFNPADAYVLQDLRAVEALTAWSACMADAGFVYRHPDDIDFDLQARYDSITQDRSIKELTAGELDSLHELQDEERAVVAANHPCESSILEPVLDRIEDELLG